MSNKHWTSPPQTQAVVKGLQHSMLTIFGNGLEIFLPKTRLKPGDDMASAKLDPPTCAERPILTAVPWPTIHTIVQLQRRGTDGQGPGYTDTSQKDPTGLPGTGFQT